MGEYFSSAEEFRYGLQHSGAELILIGVLILSLCVEMGPALLKKPALLRTIGTGGACAAIIAVLLVPAPSTGEGTLFFGHFVASTGLKYVKGLLLASYLLSLVLFDWNEKRARSGSYTSLFAALVLGTMLTLAANSLMALYVSMGLSTVTGYLLCSTGFSQKSHRTALRYALFGMLGMGALMYGYSLLYGLGEGQSFDLKELLSALLPLPSAYQIPILLLIFLGFSFKLGAFPMHFWMPNVYECMPLPVLAYLSTGSKIAIWVLLYRLSNSVEGGTYAFLATIIGFFGIIWGNLAALSQHTPRKILAYSSVAYAGLLLFPIFNSSKEGNDALPLLFGSTFYILAQYVAFASLDALESRKGRRLITFEAPDRKSDPWAWMLALSFIALAGLPPFAGFTTKFVIFSTLFSTSYGLIWVLGGLAILSSIAALFYYLKPLYLFFIKPAVTKEIESGEASFSPVSIGLRCRTALLYILIATLFALFIYPSPVFSFFATLSLKI